MRFIVPLHVFGTVLALSAVLYLHSAWLPGCLAGWLVGWLAGWAPALRPASDPHSTQRAPSRRGPSRAAPPFIPS